MRTGALKKIDMTDSARYCAPDPNALAAAPKPSLRVHAPLSTFASEADRNTDRGRQRVVTYCAAAVLEISLLAVIWTLLARSPAQQPDDDHTAIDMVQAPQEPLPQPPVPQKIELPKLKPIPVRSIPRLRLSIDRPLPVPAPQMALPSPPPPPSPPSAPPQASTEIVDRFDAQVSCGDPGGGHLSADGKDDEAAGAN